MIPDRQANMLILLPRNLQQISLTPSCVNQSLNSGFLGIEDFLMAVFSMQIETLEVAESIEVEARDFAFELYELHVRMRMMWWVGVVVMATRRT